LRAARQSVIIIIIGVAASWQHQRWQRGAHVHEMAAWQQASSKIKQQHMAKSGGMANNNRHRGSNAP